MQEFDQNLGHSSIYGLMSWYCAFEIEIKRQASRSVNIAEYRLYTGDIIFNPYFLNKNLF